jgi:hypothetical protein
MTKSNWTNIIDIYRDLGYSSDVISTLQWMEGRHLHLEELLERYRYVQPDARMFSEESLKIIMVLYDMEDLIDHQRTSLHHMERTFNQFVQLCFKQKKPAVEDSILF